MDETTNTHRAKEEILKRTKKALIEAREALRYRHAVAGTSLYDRLLMAESALLTLESILLESILLEST